MDVRAKIKDDFDFQLLGWCYPEAIRPGGAGLVGIEERPTPEDS